MPDQDIIDYIKEYRGKYDIEVLRKGLLGQGLSLSEINEAIDFVNREQEEKIEKLMQEEIVEEIIEEEIIIASPFNNNEYLQKANEKANKALGAVTDVLGIEKKDKKVYVDIFKYGALSFLFFNLITILFRYFAGRVVIAQLVSEFGTSWSLHFPDAFWATIRIFPSGVLDDNPSLLISCVWGLIVGGVVTFLFIKYMTKTWPFNIWNKLSQKVFAFYLIFNIIFGFIFNISFAEISFRHILGYLLVILGIGLGSYFSSSYFSSVMESKYGDKMKDIVLKI